MHRAASSAILAAALAATTLPVGAQPDRLVRVDLSYRAPGNGPTPNFSPYGTQVKLSDLSPNASLPEGATRPAKTGTLQVGPGQKSWINILMTADPSHPQDLTRLYLDRNRNHDFTDDGPALTANPSLNDKTKAWWSSINNVEIPIPYAAGVSESYTVNFWSVREGDEAPAMIRYSVGSWRSGSVTIGGVEALVAVMDSNNDAIFNARDEWSVLSAAEKDAPKRVLSIKEARPTSRLMFLDTGSGKELVLEFRDITPDGRSLTFAVVNRPVTKAQDRAPDDTLAGERSRPRATQPFPWIDASLDRGLAQAKESNRKIILDFWATWCGPCHTLDEWIWSDAEVVSALNAGYVGVKLDADIEKELVSRFHIEGYPTLVILDSSGKELKRFGYMPSKEMLEALKR